MCMCMCMWSGVGGCRSEPTETALDTSTAGTGADTTAAPASTGGSTSAGSASSGGPDAESEADTAGATDLGGGTEDGCGKYDAFALALAAAEPAGRAALTEAFVAAAMRSAHGLPIRCEGRLVALLHDTTGDAPALTGDFADWDPRAHPMQPVVDGHPLWVADIAVDEPLVPSLYKFVHGDTFFADPWARRHGWDAFGEYSLTDAPEGVSHHERYLEFGDGAGALQPRTLVVYVPAGALAAGPLPVVYMHDGRNLFDPTAPFGGWRVGPAVDAAIAAGVLPPLLVVGIDNTAARVDEYTPTQDDIGQGPIGGRADEYVDFVALGIKPFIDDHYPTRPGPASTAVLGSSLGGLVSLYAAWRHPGVFGLVGSMSGTLGWGQIGLDGDRILELYDEAPPVGAWIYLDSGGAPPCPGGADNYCVNVEMRDDLVDLGWDEPGALVYVHAQGASHDEAAWAARMPGFLAALGAALEG